MEAEFWIERWREGRTGFHQERITPLLQKYWPRLQLPRGSRVLVPLCGKTRDMLWLAEQGHSVLGVELSSLAVEQFFHENDLPFIKKDVAGTCHYVSDDIEIICGDIFSVSSSVLASCTGAYDRAALIALPFPMRQHYVDHVYGQLPSDYRGLLLTLEYDQSQMEGPPFSVASDEVQASFHRHTHTPVIDRRGILDKEPKFQERGLTKLDTVVYELRRA